MLPLLLVVPAKGLTAAAVSYFLFLFVMGYSRQQWSESINSRIDKNLTVMTNLFWLGSFQYVFRWLFEVSFFWPMVRCRYIQ